MFFTLNKKEIAVDITHKGGEEEKPTAIIENKHYPNSEIIFVLSG